MEKKEALKFMLNELKAPASFYEMGQLSYLNVFNFFFFF